MRSVFITGATGGIGVPTVRLLAERGYRVFAGVRDADKARVFDGLEHVLPVVLEVTDEGSVAEAARDIGRLLGGDTLDAVVNNAGLIVEGPLELVEAAELERQFRVNVFGPAAVIRAFLPLLRASRGRIVNVTAPTARRAMPYNGPISASKAALASLSVALRGELAAWGIKVVMVEPTGTDTPIFALAAESADESRRRADPYVAELYSPMIRAVRDATARLSLADPETIASVLVRAITARRPRTRYTAGRGAALLPAVGRLPDPLADAVVARALGLAKATPQ
ncbi:SDR family NAD(P)-dependent oxidoreductase [Nocardia carnea]|uniref:SDR family NAD(P)-dependent oxidoreductase n=1 Tax=Nocardia carnea TaxID=37328 RepID=UPI0024555CB5|nr:SDR family NAD(P)-dependent oxidoreductase [Nocardia carnea]